MNSTPERWLPMPGWPGYEVSDLGRFVSFWTVGSRRWIGTEPRIIEGSVMPNGYRRLMLVRCDPKERRYEGAHVLVLEAFVGPRPEAMDACHNDGNRLNNRLDNLRWDTRSSNATDSVFHGTSYLTKLTEDDVRAIRQRMRNGETPTEVARRYGLVRSTVAAIRDRITWKRVS